MQLQKINFKAESSNLLKNFQNSQLGSSSSLTVSAQTPPVSQDVKPTPQAPDVYQKNDGSVKFLKEYGGVMALALSLAGMPATYLIASRSNKKALLKMQESLKDITERLTNLHIDEKVQQALSASQKNSGKLQEMVSEKSNLISVLIGIGSGVGISEFIKNNHDKLKGMGYKDDEIIEASNRAKTLVEAPADAVNKANEARAIASQIDGKAQIAINLASDAKNTANSMDYRVNEARNRADEALGAVNSGIKPEMEKFVSKYYDLWLMKYPGWEKKINDTRSKVAMEAVNNASVKRLDRSAEDTLRDIKTYKSKYRDKLTSLWSLTAEFKPIKLGGLGDVPVDLQDNFTKLGIDSPTFIPMYETPGVSRFIADNPLSPEYTYKDKTYNLNKLADMEIEVFKNGTVELEPVEFYQSEENGKKLIFVRNKSFKGAIYDSTVQADEPEKFAIFSKAVYNLAKVKVAEALGEKLSVSAPITKYPAYNKLQAPNSMILNDWHAASMAGLLRYKAAMEYNYNEVDKGVFDALTNMPLLMIGHNLKVQGASNSANFSIAANNNVTQNIINTLYDKFALGITENAHSGIENEDLCNTVLLKRTTGDKQFNSLFHGIALADWFVPVSKNYANEIVKDANQSGIACPLLQRRKATGTLEGIINGTDLVKHDMHAIARKNYVDNLVLDAYNKNNYIDKIMELREENKRRFFHKFIVPILDGTQDKPELINPQVGRRDITEEEFMKAPLISFAHRLHYIGKRKAKFA